MYKYESLKKYLSENSSPKIVMTFEQLESIIGQKLPKSALNYRAYFANTNTHSISKAWLNAGYRVSSVNYYERTIEFQQLNQNQEYLISADIFAEKLNSNGMFEGDYFISAFSLFEVIYYRGYFEKQVYQALVKGKVKILDLNGKAIDFDLFQKKAVDIRTSLINTYNSSIKYCLINCFVNILADEERKKLIDALSDETSGMLIIDFPITSSISIWSAVFKTTIQKLATAIEYPDLSYDWAVDSISKLEYQSMALIGATGTTYMMENYLNYGLRRFILSCKDKKPFMPFSAINEMLNMLIMKEKKNLLYLTSSDDNFDILLGGIKNRVIKQ